DPCVLVIFGASGDLTKRLLVPSLYHLAAADLLPDAFAVLGVARSNLSDDDFRRRAREGTESFAGVKADPKIVSWLLERFHYVAADADDPTVYDTIARA